MHKFFAVLLRDLVSLKRPVTAAAVASAVIALAQPFGWQITVEQVSAGLVLIGTIAAAVEYQTLDWKDLVASVQRLLGKKGEAKVVAVVEKEAAGVLPAVVPVAVAPATPSDPAPPPTK